MLDQIGERWTLGRMARGLWARSEGAEPSRSSARSLGQSLAQEEEGKKLTKCRRCHARVWAHRLDKTTGECAKWCQRVPIDLGTTGRGRSKKKSRKTKRTSEEPRKKGLTDEEMTQQ